MAESFSDLVDAGVLKPGDTITNTITVNYTGKNDATIALTAIRKTSTETGFATNSLADDLLVTVDKPRATWPTSS
ncbi:hypothetical protein ODJ79_45865 [Actinoplanes sp. KI2]|uniref:hypothetical protein n=1 Tax=Actinoplanes sp. KI2 TaxID=2983315 RepID=UPI0021D5AFAF|nr:hypothetical protein [Actinoplanes sp. KI2]MCU7731086.1 hypothetical protein [Actinoplanes sp. KI2]